MDYSETVPEDKEVLETFTLATYGGKKRRSLRSSVMFIERYWQLLRPGGRLLTVIDDSVLGGKNYSTVRDFIRDRFVVRGIISLHGDAFQRAGARAKTSVMYLVKRDVDTSQPAAFVYESRYIGLDDVVPRTRPSVAETRRTQATQEITEIAEAFENYLAGQKGPWLVQPDHLDGRLDAKTLLPWSVDQLQQAWQDVGIDSAVLEQLVDLVDEPIALQPDERYEFMRISYEGHAERGEIALGREVSYSKIGRARAGDIVVSNISAVYRAICVVSKDLDHLLVSNEFTVMRLKPTVDADPVGCQNSAEDNPPAESQLQPMLSDVWGRPSRLLKNTRIGLFSWPSCVSRPPRQRCARGHAVPTRGPATPAAGDQGHLASRFRNRTKL